ncbi:MAG: hypothetical protein M3281_09475 [Chloroflexota bacterium]|nr:hypothetical protein [Chloroflexota bacterium]
MTNNPTTPSGEEQPHQTTTVSTDPLKLDLSGIIDSLQSRVEEMRQRAQQEMSRLRSQHESDRAEWEAERTELQADIDRLRTHCNSQDEQMRGLRERTQAILLDYRSELDADVHRADVARQQMENVDGLIRALDEAESAGDGTPGSTREFVPSPPAVMERRSRVVTFGEDGTQLPPEQEQTVQMPPPSEEPRTTQISISGVNSVSAMMRARRAIESMQDIRDVESRFAPDGNLYFTVRTEQDAQSIADALTSLGDPQFRARNVSESTIELEM